MISMSIKLWPSFFFFMEIVDWVTLEVFEDYLFNFFYLIVVHYYIHLSVTWILRRSFKVEISCHIFRFNVDNLCMKVFLGVAVLSLHILELLFNELLLENSISRDRFCRLFLIELRRRSFLYLRISYPWQNIFFLRFEQIFLNNREWYLIDSLQLFLAFTKIIFFTYFFFYFQSFFHFWRMMRNFKMLLSLGFSFTLSFILC